MIDAGNLIYTNSRSLDYETVDGELVCPDSFIGIDSVGVSPGDVFEIYTEEEPSNPCMFQLFLWAKDQTYFPPEDFTYELLIMQSYSLKSAL
eukprot:CAMPEP_0170549012 /NCGR_PEP_ID=MMETSP0211-20121228/7187_1 /TAXON_ID=311385 /ORGANISM="Pseudokeronopsis sp., Strain OXSARD2" /LENGTH=91 /DNA_ID=CAMNT_0010854775 /DNA_START=279 /DNA_END=551 /DNA_ORIENTATION=+